MKHVREWWQRYVAGELRTPQAIIAAAKKSEIDNLELNPAEGFDRFLNNYPVDGRFEVMMRRLVHAKHEFSTAGAIRQHERADWQNVDPRIALFAAKFIELLRVRYQVGFFCHSAYRTKEEQNQAVARGNSRTPWPAAAHCQGAAVDLVHLRYAWDLSRAEWACIGTLGKDLHVRMMQQARPEDRFKIVWGGDWTSLYDPAHWEIAGWKDDISIPIEGVPIRAMPRHILASRGILSPPFDADDFFG